MAYIIILLHSYDFASFWWWPLPAGAPSWRQTEIQLSGLGWWLTLQGSEGATGLFGCLDRTWLALANTVLSIEMYLERTWKTAKLNLSMKCLLRLYDGQTVYTRLMMQVYLMKAMHYTYCLYLSLCKA